MSGTDQKPLASQDVMYPAVESWSETNETYKPPWKSRIDGVSKHQGMPKQYSSPNGRIWYISSNNKLQIYECFMHP